MPPEALTPHPLMNLTNSIAVGFAYVENRKRINVLFEQLF